MAGASIGWDETDPANSKNLGLGALDIRSAKSAIRTGLDAEHVWPSSGGVAGHHRLGSGRAYVDASSALSSDGTTGHIFFNTSNSQVYSISATSAHRLGGVGVPYVGDEGVTFSINNHRVNIYCGAVRVNSSGTAPVTFNSVYSGLPFIQLTPYTTGVSNSCVAYVTALSSTSMTIEVVDMAGVAISSKTIFWQSTGSAHHLQTMA
jgi:hypothetical protein